MMITGVPTNPYFMTTAAIYVPHVEMDVLIMMDCSTLAVLYVDMSIQPVAALPDDF